MIRLWPLLIAALALLAPGETRAEWLRAESANFVAYSEGDEATLRDRVQRLEEFDRVLRRLTGTDSPPSPNRLTLVFVRGAGEAGQIWHGVRGVEGFYAASPDGVLAVVDHGFRQDWSTHEEVLLHEYAHHFMMQYFPAAYPPWYVEGFAEYVATARFRDEVLEIGRANEGRASWLGDRSAWLPFDQLVFGDPGELRGRDVAKFYAQSWLLVHYLLRDPERARRLGEFLTDVGRGDEARAAFTRRFGMTLSDLRAAVMNYADGGGMTYSRLPRMAAGEAPQVRIEVLAGVSDALLLTALGSRLTRTVPADAARFLRQARSVAEGRDEPLARRLLARAEALYGDGDTADRLLEPLLAAAPQDAELLYFQGMRHLVAGRRDEANRAAHFREAQGWFVRAHRADGDHFPTLYRYAESLSAEPVFLSDNTMNVLLLAHQLAPQVQEIAFSTANLLMRRGRFDEAAALLAPLAVGRHGGGFAGAARALLAKARARDPSGLPGAFDIPQEED